jgi:multiple sugar transport system ATP-binding protein
LTEHILYSLQVAAIILEHVSKVYPGGFKAVNDVSLEIQDEEFVVLVGPSGCGKSTTLRMIAGLDEISGGNIYIDGHRVNDVAAMDRDIAMVFQNYALYPHLTAYENMSFGLTLRKYARTEIDSRVREAAQILGITDEQLGRKPKALSGGQRQRVAVGRAIVRHPKAFLFDEPLSNLDARMRVEMRAEISKLRRRLRATTIYVTHDQVEAMTMGDRIVVMKDGAVQQVGDPLNLYDRPRNQFVAGFIGAPPMNFFRGVIESRSGSLWFVEKQIAGTAGFATPLPEQIWKDLSAYVDRPVVFGSRPEDLSVLTSAGGADSPICARVEVVEPMGAETCLHLNTGVHSLIARVAPHERPAIGQQLGITFDMRKCHFFDAATTLTIV